MAGIHIDKYVPDYVLFDLETTGTSTKVDAVIEISAIKVRAGKPVDEFSTLVNPCRSIPYYASQVNHITDDMVAQAPVFEKVLETFLEFAGDEVLVGHNIHKFDMQFIYRDAMEYYGKIPENPCADTLVMARNYLPQLSHHRLSDLAQYYGISTEGAHRALNDCRMNQIIYEKLGIEYETIRAGQTELRLCPECSSVLKIRNGRYGRFWGCSGFPRCRYTQNA